MLGSFSKVFQIFYKNRQNVCIPINFCLTVSKMPFYAVAKGRTTGIFMTWADCEAQVKGFSGAKYKKFDSVVSAQDFISPGGGNGGPSTAAKPQNSNKTYGNTSNANLKRTYSSNAAVHTSALSSNNQKSDKSSRSNFSSSRSGYEDDEGDSFDSDDLGTIINKQMDDIEQRLNSFTKGISKIVKKSSKSSGRSTILIEPPEPKRPRKNANNEFEEDSEGYVQVYTDGACSANGRNGARAGIGVYWGEGHSLNVSEPVSGRATNNCGEIQAATRAIQQALQSGVKKLTINTDSQFVINSVTKWMPGWKRKGWKLASGEPVKNEKDFKELDSVQNKLEIKWKYVEAHRGIHGNEMADQLAKAGAALYNK